MDAVVPYLWGDWHCTANPRMFIAQCQACGGELWIHRNGESDWRASCENGCTLEQIQAGAERAAAEQDQQHQKEREARNAVDTDDPFYGLKATDYIEALTGQEPSRGFFRCPFHGDGHERTPSLHAHGVFWYCHACGIGGTVYDFAANQWGIEPRGKGFVEIQGRLLTEMPGRLRARNEALR